MTDRVRRLTVVLDGDYRDDDVESIVEAIKMIRGVARVEQHVVDAQDHIARTVVRAEYEAALHKAIDQVFALKKFDRNHAAWQEKEQK